MKKYLNIEKHSRLIKRETGKTYREVIRTYNSPGRFYHDAEHIDQMLGWAEWKYSHSEFYESLILAIVFHDWVYEINHPKGQNETSSKNALLKSCNGSSLGKIAAEAILATIDHNIGDNELENALVLTDLSGWKYGSCETLFKAEMKLFKEFQRVPFSEYRDKRNDFLQAFQRKNLISDANIEYQKIILNSFTPKVGVFAGSFSPLHSGHINVIEKAERIFDKVIIAQGKNPSKPDPRRLPDSVRWRECIEYRGFLSDLLTDLEGDVTLIRGIRNHIDLINEQSMAQFIRNQNSEIKIAYILCDPEFQHISSTAIREIKSLESKSSSRYSSELYAWNETV